MKQIKVGSCTHSDITVFSFHPVKIITTGEGGMAVTNNNELATRMRRLRTHGITSDNTLMQLRPDNEIWNYQQIELGFNYRMTDIQAALGLKQMTRLDGFVQRRHEIAKRYDAELPTVFAAYNPLSGNRQLFQLSPVTDSHQSSSEWQNTTTALRCALATWRSRKPALHSSASSALL